MKIEERLGNDGSAPSPDVSRPQQSGGEPQAAQLAAILLSMGDAVMVVDTAGKLLLTNAAYDQSFGSGNRDLVLEDESGQPLPTDMTPLRRAARGESFSMEFFAGTADNGSRCWFEAKGRPIYSDGQVQGGVVVIRDITERSLRRLQDEFLAMASHELRTPLTALHGYLEMVIRLLAATPENERQLRFASQALKQSRRLGALVSDLVDVTRLQTGKLGFKLEPLDLIPLVQQTVETAQALAEGQRIRVTSSPGRLEVNGDAGRLEQLLLNLLTNAISYAPETEDIDVRLSRADGCAELQVQDYGAGIPEDDQNRIFSRFYQVGRTGRPSQSGLGLGLFISREIVNAHGGEIAVSSEEGKGTTFTVRLPLLSARPHGPAADEAAP